MKPFLEKIKKFTSKFKSNLTSQDKLSKILKNKNNISNLYTVDYININLEVSWVSINIFSLNLIKFKLAAERNVKLPSLPDAKYINILEFFSENKIYLKEEFELEEFCRMATEFLNLYDSKKETNYLESDGMYYSYLKKQLDSVIEGLLKVVDP